jgi:2-polyprenyl-3-methyl-5-hydroxy-6-metoxy-1,4-benzoquinol methylase
MKYYELHEDFWKQLAQKGHISWDKESEAELMSRERNLELKKFIGDTNNGTMLDLGSGSGSQSFYMSSLGFRCTAVDISQTAISIGKKLANKMKLDIEFLCDDICKLDLEKTFDIVTDSCLLHCLVTSEDREAFFDVARKHMNHDGRLFIYTMIRNENQKLFQETDYVYLDKDGVLWSKGPDRYDVDWTEINGEKYFPHRRIHTCGQQRDEILKNNFQIVEENIIEGKDNENSTYVAWLK